MGRFGFVKQPFLTDVAGDFVGDYGTWHFIGARPDMFAATIPFAGAGNPALAQNMVNLPV